MKKVGGAAVGNKELEQKLAKLETIESKLNEVEDVIYKTKRSQLQLLNIINQSQMYQGDSFSALRNVIAEFIASIWTVAKEKFDEEGIKVDHVVREMINTFDEETSRVRENMIEGGQRSNTRGQKHVDRV